MSIKSAMAKKMGGVKLPDNYRGRKLFMKKMMEENRKHPTHDYRHLMSQGSSKKYLDTMEERALENIWKYSRENRISESPRRADYEIIMRKYNK